MNLLAIDPGLVGTGWAVWQGKDHTPIACGVINGPRDVEWQERVDVIVSAILDIIYQYDVLVIVCEQMEMYETAASSMSWKTGDLQRTVFLIGSISGATRRKIQRMVLTPPREWKGQLPKSVTIYRVKKTLGADVCRRLNIKTHAWDAVGIGLWFLGRKEGRK